MKHHDGSYIIMFIAIILVLVGCNNDNGSKVSGDAMHDIKQTAAYIMELTAAEPERAMEAIDSLRKAGLADYETEWLRAKVYSQSLESLMLDSAITIGERLMRLDEAQENLDYRQDLLETLVNACRRRHDDERTLKWVAELVALNRQRGEVTEALRNEAEMVVPLSHTGRYQEGLAKLDSVLAVLDTVKQFNELDASIVVSKRKVEVLKEARRYEDIIPVARLMLKRLADYEQHPDEYHDGSYREPADEDRPGYIDFYRAKAYSYLAEAYARKSLLFRSENLEGSAALDSARHYVSLFEQSNFGQTFDGRTMIAPTCCLLGETEKLDAVYEDIATARFQAHEQQMEKERLESEASLWRIINRLIGVISFLLACFAIYYFLRHREGMRKNRILARQITEAMEYKEKFFALQSAGEPAIDEDISAMEPVELFRHISQVIVRDKLFLDPSFDRQAAVAHFHLSKERIGAAFSQGSNYANISDFINECRLEYAVNMLSDQPSLPVSQVAQACGFSDANYFGRKFKARYGLSPTAYRAGNSV